MEGKSLENLRSPISQGKEDEIIIFFMSWLFAGPFWPAGMGSFVGM